MPLRFDPASILAPGGIASGLDDLGAAVMNAMNRRAERKYALEGETRRRGERLADEGRQRRFQWWHDAASAGPEQEPGYLADPALTDLEKEQLESIRQGALANRMQRAAASSAKAGAGSVVPGAPTQVSKTDTSTGRPRVVQMPTTIRYGIDALRTGLARAAQAGKTALAEGYKQKIGAGERAAAVLGDPDPDTAANLQQQYARIAAAEGTPNAEGKLQGGSIAADIQAAKALPPMPGTRTGARETLVANTGQSVEKLKATKARAAALAGEYLNASGALSPFADMTDEEQRALYGQGQEDLAQFRSPTTIDANGVPVMSDEFVAALAGDESLPPDTGAELIDETAASVPDAAAVAARVADIRERLRSANFDDSQLSDDELIAQYGMTDQE